MANKRRSLSRAFKLEAVGLMTEGSLNTLCTISVGYKRWSWHCGGGCSTGSPR